MIASKKVKHINETVNMATRKMSISEAHTVAQKTAPMFAYFLMIALVQHADIIQGSETFVYKTTLS